jgi:hypothetical protein
LNLGSDRDQRIAESIQLRLHLTFRRFNQQGASNR